jgi:hypothetical protein
VRKRPGNLRSNAADVVAGILVVISPLALVAYLTATMGADPARIIKVAAAAGVLLATVCKAFSAIRGRR